MGCIYMPYRVFYVTIEIIIERQGDDNLAAQIGTAKQH